MTDFVKTFQQQRQQAAQRNAERRKNSTYAKPDRDGETPAQEKTVRRKMPLVTLHDWECAGCGHVFYQKKSPLHCIKCNGISMIRRKDPCANVVDPLDFVLDMCENGRRCMDLARLAMSKVRTGKRGLVEKNFLNATDRINQAVRILTLIPNPDEIREEAKKWRLIKPASNGLCCTFARGAMLPHASNAWVCQKPRCGSCARN